MSKKIFLNGNTYLGSKDAGKLVGYSYDYVSRLAREGKVRAQKVGQSWFVDPASLQKFAANQKTNRALRGKIMSATSSTPTMTPRPRSSFSTGSGFATSSTASYYRENKAVADIKNSSTFKRRTASLANMRTHLDAARNMASANLAKMQAAASAANIRVTPTPNMSLMSAANRVVAFSTAISLVFGLYAMADPQYRKFAIGQLETASKSVVSDTRNAMYGLVDVLHNTASGVDHVAADPVTQTASAFASFGSWAHTLAAGTAEYTDTILSRLSIGADRVVTGTVGGLLGKPVVQVSVRELPEFEGQLKAKVAALRKLDAEIDTKVTYGDSKPVVTESKSQVPVKQVIVNKPIQTVREVYTQKETVREVVPLATIKSLVDAQVGNSLDENYKNSLRTELLGIVNSRPSAPQVSNYGALSLTQRIDNLSGTNISNADISGSSISGGSISGASAELTVLNVSGVTGLSTVTAADLTLSGDLTVQGDTTLAATDITDLTLSAELRDAAGDAGTAGQVLTTTGAGVDWVDPSTLTITEVDTLDTVAARGATTTETLTAAGFTTAGTVAAADVTATGDATVGGTLDVTGAVTFLDTVATTGLATFSSGINVNSETITDFTGTGLQLTSGALGTTLGTTIESSEITDGTVSNTDLANSTVSYGGISLALGASDATPAFNLSDATSLPISTGVSGLGTGIATFLGTPSSANLASALTDETGTGSAVFSASPTFTGTITGTNLTLSGTTTLSGLSAGTDNSVLVLNSSNQVVTDEIDSRVWGSTLLANIVEDTTPQLGGNLDVNGQTITSASNGDINIAPDGTGDFIVNTDQLYVDTSAGNVGIGTTNPLYTLSVNGGTNNVVASFASSNTTAKIRVYDDTGSAYVSASGGIAYFGASTTNLNNLAVDSSGNVGIGTTSPGNKLEIGGTSITNNTEQSSIEFSDGSSQANAFITGYRGSSYLNGELAFSTQQSGTKTEVMRLDESGNVGIGTTTPSYKLDVNGTGRFVGAVTLDSTLGVTGATTLSSTLSVSGLATFSSGINVNSETITDFTGTGLQLTSGALGTTLGTTIESSEITDGTIVNADISSSAAISVSKTALTAGTNITLSGDTLNVDDAFLINSGDDTTSGTITAAGFTTTGATATGTLSTTGAATISNLLTVNNSSYAQALFKTSGTTDRSSTIQISNNNTTARKWDIGVGGTGNGLSLTSGEFYLYDYGAGAARFTIDTSGSVGIGTTTPSYKLDVNGTGRFVGAVTLDSTLGVTGATTLSSTLSVSGLSTLADLTVSDLTASRLVATDASSNLVSTITEANLESSISDVTDVFTNNDTITTANIADSYLLNTGDTGAGAYTFTGTLDTTGTVLQGASPLVFEGLTDDLNETTFAITDPTADRTITFPNATGEVSLLGQSIEKGELANSGILTFDWADSEVADDLTISGGAVDNTPIGATTPAAGTFTTLTVSAQCVTADTRLRRRRRRKKDETDEELEDNPIVFDFDDEYVYEHVQIIDIKKDDEVASLDRETGMFVYKRVNGLIPTGIQPLFAITTQTRRIIRTTATHPYLVRARKSPSKQQKLYRFEVDMSMKIESYAHDTIVAIANEEMSYTVKIPKELKQTLRDKYARKAPREFKPALYALAIVVGLRQMNESVHELMIDADYKGHIDVISRIITEHFPRIEVHEVLVGKKSPAHFACYGVHKGAQEAGCALTANDVIGKIENALPASFPQYGESGSESHQAPSNINTVANKDEFVKAKWMAASELCVGQEVAVAHGDTPAWEKIVNIKALNAEAVWDIEIDGTHNFIGNDIVAHNTYLNGGTTIGDASGDALTINSSAVSVPNNLNFDSNTFVVDSTNNRVGVGTATPSDLLVVGGSVSSPTFTTDPDKAITVGSITDGEEVALQLSVADGTNNIRSKYFVDDTTLWAGVDTTYSSGLNGFSLGIAGDKDLVITPAGNVGIGTTSPSYLLDVAGTLNATGAATLGSTLGVTGLATFSSGINVNSETITDFTGTGLQLTSGALGTTLGTTIESSEITDGTIVNADISSSAAISVSKTALTAGTNITLSGDTLNVDDAFLINSGDDTTSGTITAAGFTTTGATATGTLSTTGAATISNLLTVNNSSYAQALFKTSGTTDRSSTIQISNNNTTARKWDIGVGGTGNGLSLTSGEFYLYDYGAGAARFTIDTSGNIGIGTTSPSYKLDVNGTGRFVGAVTLDSTLGVTGATTLSSTLSVSGLSTLADLTVSDLTASRLVATDASSNLVSTITEANLESSISDVTDVFTNNDTITSANIADVYLRNDADDTTSGTITAAGFTTTGATATGTLTVGGDTFIGDAATDSITIRSKPVYLPNGLNLDNGTLYIDSGNNLVGIGTASPSAKLDILKSTGSDTPGTNLIQALSMSSTQGFGYRYSADTNYLIMDRLYGGAWNSVMSFSRTNGNVGIGTTSPSAKLGVVQSGGAAGDLLHLRDSTDGMDLAIRFDGTQSFQFRSEVGGAGNDLLTLNTNGNVGIGTTAPQYPLHIEGSGATYQQIESTGSSNAGLVLSNADNTYTVGVRATTGTFTIADAEGISGGERLSITNTGNVGIGTTSPGALLNLYTQPVGGGRVTPNANADELLIENNSNAGITIGTANVGNIFVGDNNTSNLGQLAYAVTDNSWRFATNTTEKVRITSAGNVGIGTASPGRKLEVSDGSSFQLRLNNPNTGGTTWDLGSSDDAWGAGGGKLTFVPSGGGSIASVLTMQSNGNIGIGTTTPSYKLDVSGSAAVLGYFSGSFAGPQGIRVQRNSGDYVDLQANYSGYGGGLSSAGPLRFAVNTNGLDSPSMFINTSGNVGIGTTSPDSKLEINGGTLKVTGNTVETIISYSDRGIIGTATNDDLEIRTNNTEAVRIDTSGNVGIGATSPGAKLDVTDATTPEIRITPGASTTADPTLYLKDTGTTNGFKLWYDNSAGDTYFDNKGDNDAYGMFFRTKTDGTAVDALTITGAGNVGIGTTTPSYTLDVAGDINTTGTLRVNGTAFGIDELSDGQNDSTNNNLFLGQAGFSGTFYNDKNTVLGRYAFDNANTDSSNAAYGDSNTAIGYQVLTNNTTGYSNSAQGAYALYFNTTGVGNSALGVNTLYENTTGVNNTAVGINAGRFIADGSTANTTGDYNLFLGANTKALADGDQNEIVIGYNATGIGSNSVVLGNDSITTTALKGNVGIGTTSPSTILSVEGSADANGGIISANGTGTTGGISLYDNGVIRGVLAYGDNGNIFTGASANSLSLRSEGNLHIGGGGNNLTMTLDTSGNVGIGDTTPNGKLGVGAGHINLDDSYSLRWGDNTARILGSGASDILSFYTSNTEQVRIDSSGNVGIGTTSPGANLEVVGTGNIFKVTNDDSSALIYAGESADDAFFKMYKAGGANKSIELLANGDSYFNGGNVGIGTTTPGYKLDVYQGNLGVHGTVSNSYLSSTGNLLVFERASANYIAATTAGGYFDFIVNGNTQSDATAALTLQADNDVIVPNGNVGIGITSPSENLTIEGTGGKTFGLRNINDVSTEIKLLAARSSAGATLGNVSGYWIDTTDAAERGVAQLRFLAGDDTINEDNGEIAFLTAASAGSVVERMRIDSTGNVGIGTTNPGSLLHIKGASGTTRLNIDGPAGQNTATTYSDNGTAKWQTSYIASNGNYTIYDAVNITTPFRVEPGAGSNTFVVDSNSRVGLNTTTPTAQLHTVGNLSSALTGTVSVTAASTTVTGTSTAFTTELSVGDSIKIGSETFTVSAIASDTSLTLDSAHSAGASGATAYTDPNLFALDNGDSVSKFVVDSSGNVGVGTASPETALTVYKFLGTGSTISDLQIITQNTSAATTDRLSGIAFRNADSSSNAIYSGIYAEKDTADTVKVNIDVNSDTKLTLLNSGNVGIGTTSPSQKLDVAGNIMLTGNNNLYFGNVTNERIGYTGTNLQLLTQGALQMSAVNGVQVISGNTFRIQDSTNTDYVTFSHDGTDFNIAGTNTTDINITGANLNYNAGTLFANTSGNVGIGTTNPGARLDVRTDSADDQVLLALQEDAGFDPGPFYFELADTGISGLASKNMVIRGGSSVSDLAFSPSSDTPAALVLKDGGNVGIGTTAPSAKLEVSDTNTTAGQRTTPVDVFSIKADYNGGDGNPYNGFGGGVVFNNRSYNGAFYDSAAIYGIIGDDSIDTTEGGKLAFYTASTKGAALTEKVRITEAGNVGIGTTSPSYKLDVQDSSGNAMIRAYAPSGIPRLSLQNSGKHYSISVQGSSWYFFDESAGASRMIIDTSGNVGIGTTNPLYTLSVNGGTNNVVASFASSNTTAKLRVYDDTGSAYVSASGGIAYFGASSTNANNLAVDSSGNVGIGTTSPADVLDVQGDIRVGTGTTGCVKDADGTVIAGTCSSDENLKTNIVDITDVLDSFKDLRIVNYNWNQLAYDEYKYGTEANQIGALAQNVESLFPELVVTDSKGYKQVNYTGLQLYAFEAIKELSIKMSDLEAQQAEPAEVQDRAGIIAIISDWLENLGIFFSESLAKFNNLAAAAFTVGTPEKPNGITLYDEVTGEAYCVKIKNGAMVSEAGECTAAGQQADDAEPEPQAPVITLRGNNPAMVALNAQYSDMGAVATIINADGQEVTISHTLWLDGTEVQNIEIDTTADATYTVEYKAVHGELETVVSREIIVGEGAQEPPAEEPEGDDGESDAGTGDNTGGDAQAGDATDGTTGDIQSDAGEGAPADDTQADNSPADNGDADAATAQGSGDTSAGQPQDDPVVDDQGAEAGAGDSQGDVAGDTTTQDAPAGDGVN